MTAVANQRRAAMPAGVSRRVADRAAGASRWCVERAAVAVVAATVSRWLTAGWRYLREVSGDDAYERYLAHHAARHAGEKPMTAKAYFAERQRQKWSGVTRCC